jgi:prevent-host-death family protein
MDRVGIRELKQNASAVVARAAAGEPLIITDRGRPVAQLVPLAESTFEAMVRTGAIRKATRSLADLPPPRDLGFSLSDEIIRRREDERY